MRRLQSVQKRCRTSHHRRQAMRAHQASPTSAALAASPRPQTNRFQDIHPRLSFVGWHCSCIPSWRMYAGYRRWPSSFAVCWYSNVLGQEITQPVRWPLFCHRRANAVEQSAWTASATGHHLRTLQTIVWKRLYLVSWAAAPCFWTLRAQTRNLLTYLRTYLPCRWAWFQTAITTTA